MEITIFGYKNLQGLSQRFVINFKYLIQFIVAATKNIRIFKKPLLHEQIFVIL